MILLRTFDHLRRAVWRALGHGAFNSAKAAAFSAILSIFPALLVITTLLALTPETDTVRSDIRNAFSEFLPTDTMSLVQTYFFTNHARSVRLVWTAVFITIGAAMGVMLSLMDGFRRAYLLPRGEWSFWREHAIALVLVPATFVPLIFATALVAFGHAIEHWMVDNSDHEIRFYVLLIWRVIRWGIATLDQRGGSGSRVPLRDTPCAPVEASCAGKPAGHGRLVSRDTWLRLVSHSLR